LTARIRQGQSLLLAQTKATVASPKQCPAFDALQSEKHFKIIAKNSHIYHKFKLFKVKSKKYLKYLISDTYQDFKTVD